MEFAEAVRRRRMVHAYREEPIPAEVLAHIVNLALRSPSAGFSQGVSFVIVTDPAVRKTIAALGNEDEYVAIGFDAWISAAPAHVVVCVEEEAYRRRYREPDKARDRSGAKSLSVAAGEALDWPVPYWWVDAGAALMVVLLGAVDQGLAAGFLGVHSLPGLAEVLGLPPDVSPIGVVTVGHGAPARPSRSPARGFRSNRDVVHWQRWGGTLL